MIRFSGRDFDTAEGLSRIFDVTTAACAFPGLYAPVELAGLGPCIDGGTVNNAPIRYALDEGDVDHIIMPIPFPPLMSASRPLQGWGLMNHLVEILINERLYRDLKDANVVNHEVEELQKLVSRGVLSVAQLKTVQSVLRTRWVQITEVRPTTSQSGNAFAGFFCKKERIRLLAEGRKAAGDVLSRIDAENRKRFKRKKS